MKRSIRVMIQRLPGNDDLSLPSYMSEGAVAMDIAAALSEPLTVHPDSIAVIPTGFAVAIPSGYEGQLRPRSGLATKYGLTLPNSPATIDADYRGELRVPLINLGRGNVTIVRGMRIAQLVIVPILRVKWEEVVELPQTPRGDRGFGHTDL